MKIFSRAALAVALLFITFFAHANATPPTTPAPDPSSTSSSTSAAGAAAISAAEAAAKATSGAVAGSVSQGGSAAQDQKQQQGQTAQNAASISSGGDRSGYYVLPGPVWTPPMAKVECPTPKIENRSLAVGWGLFSIARGDTFTDDCYDFIYVNGLIEQCQYEQAFHYRTMMGKKRYPDLPTPKKPTGTLDYGPDECASAKRLMTQAAFPPAPVYNHYETVNPAPTPAVCPAPPAAKKKRVVVGKKAIPPCTPGK